jgi:DnaD/phage-associated family protein
MAFTGFPGKVMHTPVPNPVFGPLLEQIDDLVELKLTLRLVWLFHQKRGYPRYVTLLETLKDQVLVRSTGASGDEAESIIRRALSAAVDRGTLVSAAIERNAKPISVYILNTEANVRAIRELGEVTGGYLDVVDETSNDAETRPNIFALYEDNIGMLSPIIADELKLAEEAYPQEWIEDAFRRAVAQNKRSWRYIAAILERWEREGRSDGRPVGSSQRASYY